MESGGSDWAATGVATAKIARTNRRMGTGREDVNDVILSAAKDLLNGEILRSLRSLRMTFQNSICAPSSTTRFGGIWKNSVAPCAFRDMIANTFLRQRAIRELPIGISRSRPRKNDVS